jgi:hypothetical protein
MAEPIKFEEQNFEYKKPENMTEDECGSLPCYIWDGGVISKWKFSDGEIEQIKENGFVFVNTFGIPPQPIAIFTKNPFYFENDREEERQENEGS